MKNLTFLSLLSLTTLTLYSCSIASYREEKENKSLKIDTISLERMVEIQIFPIIPDHGINNLDSLKRYATPELSNALIEAYDTPTKSPGDIGDEDFLWYFISGNGDIQNSDKPKANLISLYGDTLLMGVNFNTWDHILKLIKVNNQWILDDFDNMKQEIVSYNSDAREFFTSGEYRKLEYTPDEWQNKVKMYFEKYLNKPYEPIINAIIDCQPQGADVVAYDPSFDTDIDESLIPEYFSSDNDIHLFFARHPVFINPSDGTKLKLTISHNYFYNMWVGDVDLGMFERKKNRRDPETLYLYLFNMESKCPTDIPFILKLDGINTTLTLMPPKINNTWGKIYIAPNGSVSYLRTTERPAPQTFKLYRLIKRN